MSDLFSDAAKQRLPEVAPLALRMRPQSLEEFVGQEQVLGEGSALRLAIEDGPRALGDLLRAARAAGKTTLARIIARTTGAAVRGALGRLGNGRGGARGPRARRASGSAARAAHDPLPRRDPPVQQGPAGRAAARPSRRGSITLIGATTENPYFEVNSALLSRCQVYELEPLSTEELATIVRRGAAELGVGASPTTSSSKLVAARAGGDARTALNILELACADRAGRRRRVAGASTSRTPRASGRSSTTRAATRTTTSSRPSSSRCAARIPTRASTTSRRCSRAARTPRFIARRMIVLASEDIGNADPRALLVAVAAAQAVEHVGLPGGAAQPRAGGDLPRPRAEVERRATSRSGGDAAGRAGARPHPVRRRHSATRAGTARQLGHGEGYIYPHDDPAGFDVDNLPDELKGTTYYEPSGQARRS